MSFTEFVEAPSISITSMLELFVIALQDSQVPQGVQVGALEFWQFSDFAKILAVEVFPHPRGPVKRYACAICPVFIEFLSVSATNSCPAKSSNFCGRRRVAVTS